MTEPGPSTGTQNDAKQHHNATTNPRREQSEDEKSRRSPWPGSAVCSNGHQEIFVHCESGRSLESPARHCKDGPHQGGNQERTEAKQTVKQADNHIRELKSGK